MDELPLDERMAICIPMNAWPGHIVFGSIETNCYVPLKDYLKHIYDIDIDC